jgi:hypothetical protein
VITDSDCAWIPTRTNSWIVFTSGGSGNTGRGSISWSAGPNTGPPRTAEIVVMSETFVVIQAGS